MKISLILPAVVLGAATLISTTASADVMYRDRYCATDPITGIVGGVTNFTTGVVGGAATVTNRAVRGTANVITGRPVYYTTSARYYDGYARPRVTTYYYYR